MSESNDLNSLAAQHPEVATLMAERDEYREKIQQNAPNFSNLGDIPPGHYYSTIPDLAQVRQNEARLFGQISRTLPGIDLKESEQLSLVEYFADHFYEEMPFQRSKVDGLRFYFDNVMFSYGDAISLYCMIRHLRPRRIVEIGSGFSSAVSLDTNDLFFNGQIKTTFIEPNNERLLSLLKPEDKTTSTIVKGLAQDVDLSIFMELQQNDILFIDSSHVSKIGSDVNRIIFEILPSLAPGVHIHFHDVFLPLEYPSPWIYEGRAWNEAYLLRAFLQYNDTFDVVLMNTFMGHFHADLMRERMPLFMSNPGASFWLRKTK